MSLAHLGPIETSDGFDDPKAYVAHLMEQSGSSFTLGMKILSRPRREAMFAIYAFCRVVDDIADEEGDIDEKRSLLSAWRNEVNDLFNGKPQSLVGKALLEPIEQFSIPKQEFLLLIDGMAADVEGPVVAPSLNELLGYTRRVAGTVGEMSIRIFGVSDRPEREVFSLNLADAFQLTNILRDVEDDADIGRLYLPEELLSKYDIDTRIPLDVARHPNLQKLCKELGGIARARFDEARRARKVLEGEPLRPALIMMGVYEGYLELMEKADFAQNPDLYKMSKLTKLTRGLRYGFFFPVRPLRQIENSVPPLADIQVT